MIASRIMKRKASTVAILGVSSGASIDRPTSSKRIGGIFIPDYSDVMNYTKSPAKMSDDKFHNAIVEQAIPITKYNK